MTENQSNWTQPEPGAPEPPVRGGYFATAPAYGEQAAQAGQAPAASGEPPASAESAESPAGADPMAVEPAAETTAGLPAEAASDAAADVAPAEEPSASAAAAPSASATSPLPDTSGIDTAGHISQTSTFMPVSASATESFAAARSGDTDVMPRAEGERVQVPYRNDAAAAPLASQPAAGAAYGASQQPFAAQQPSAGQQGYRTSAQAQQAPQAQRAQASAPNAAKPKKGPSGAGKTFLFGFLGALCACALALGGFAFAGGFKSPVPTGTALIGTTDQSVINAVDEGQTLAEAVAEKALPSVVAIYNYQSSSGSYGYGYGYGMGNQGGDNMVATGMGSGVVISDEGYIITNYHVVEDAAKLTVSVDGVERDATYVGGDSSSDIAVVKVEDNEGLVAADIGDSDSLRIGEWVMTIGAPLGLEQSVATGVVSATNRSQIMDSSSDGSDLYSYFYGSSNPEYTYYPNMIQTDAVINPGNSGGALVDADGKLIGINAMISSYSGDYAGVGFAIPVNYAISIAEDVIAGKEPTHAMLGVSLSQVNSQIAQRYNLSADQGAYISAISPDSGAAASDLAVGDIITKIDGKAVTSPTDVTLDIRAKKVGDTVTVTVNRDGETVDVDVTLTSDESIAQSTSSEQEESAQDDSRQNGPGSGSGRGDGWGGDGNGRGYNIEDLEELLKMFGM